MHEGMRGRALALRMLALALLGACAMVVSGVAAASASAETTWLCKPGIENNPCESSLETTVELSNGGSFVEHPKDAANPPIDCFYVYPTVSSQFTANANLEIDPEERQIAIDQASRFSQTCKVYAPIYPQLTIPALNTPGAVTPETAAIAYIGVATAFAEYLGRYNHGRGILLIGHSQGAAMLTQLIKEQFDPATPQGAALRHLLVGADLLGGNILVPKGKTVGGSFKNVPACRLVGQTHCVVAYSSFLKEPPNPSNFGRVGSPLLGLGGGPSEEELENDEVLCTNPAAFSFNSQPGWANRFESTSPFPGLLGPFVTPPPGSTPWVSMPAQYTAQCKRANGATWLQLTPNVPGDPRPAITEPLGPEWGTHLEDVNAALGNLVLNSAVQSILYGLLH
jgi:Protein of unknown function (DUF3089)